MTNTTTTTTPHLRDLQDGAPVVRITYLTTTKRPDGDYLHACALTVQMGVTYDNKGAVKVGRTTGALRAENAGLSGREYVAGEPFYMVTTRGNVLIRCALTVDGNGESHYYDPTGAEITRSQWDEAMPASKRPGYCGKCVTATGGKRGTYSPHMPDFDLPENLTVDDLTPGDLRHGAPVRGQVFDIGTDKVWAMTHKGAPVRWEYDPETDPATGGE